MRLIRLIIIHVLVQYLGACPTPPHPIKTNNQHCVTKVEPASDSKKTEIFELHIQNKTNTISCRQLNNQTPKRRNEETQVLQLQKIRMSHFCYRKGIIG